MAEQVFSCNCLEPSIRDGWFLRLTYLRRDVRRLLYINFAQYFTCIVTLHLLLA